MRQAFKQKLIEIIPALQGRVYDVQPPSQTAEEPYAVMALGEEIWKSSWAGYRQVVRIKLYAGQAGLAQADVWANALIAGLHREPVTGAGEDTSAFTAHYLGVRDAEKLDTVAGKAYRTLRFGVYVPETEGGSPAPANGATQPEEWLGALVRWTQKQLGETWSVYADAWPAQPGRHAVLWRMSGCETRMAGASMYELRKRFIGHITAPDTTEENRAASALIEGFAAQIQLPLDQDKGRYMSTAEASADLQADAILDGQLRLMLVQRRMRPAEEAALIRRVEIHPILK
ncbi:hypothetical protein GMA19_01099 [Paenibacillus polymyxa E681]|uniref:hypothetical protein n=1 Tax=Paenibacillus polymyxa TaxID=1406 RepID=UPI0001E311ED|nr:hypothetical protein [Paenibacillus polymyxa]ADM68938.1 hypothetical protein PPE_01090 [Paenibacillus polymyxa E681]QNV55946.1 hypothetical protein GE561_01099 [Paenibacillus polymyxa E681]QNV60783.1 hypothetical protein GMA19_01099 [Paenibacillus polymyxa E681]